MPDVGLATLKPRAAAQSLVRLQTLTAKPDVIERQRGRAGVKQRERIRKRDRYTCCMCMAGSIVRRGEEVDHRIPLEDGGSDDDSNLWLICAEHHASKTAAEAARRAGGGSKVAKFG